MYEAISIEERNKPAVALIYKDFTNDSRSAASSRGMPGVRTVPETIPSEWTDMEDIEDGITAVMDEVIDALTKPLTNEEKSPKREVEKPARIIFKGNLEEVNRFFYQRGWTDGLPVIPPTEEAVAEMLTGTDLAPDHLVAKLGPRLGKATVEKIAINAAMAGALPTYMPLLIAGVQALMDPLIGPSGLAVSTHTFTPFWIINGPICKDLHINGSYGALSPGDIANATIGRTMGLITKNIRGVRKGVEDMGVLGNPGRYSMVVAENEDDNPWEPLHIEHGFDKEDNTITLSFSSSFEQILPYGTDDKSLLDTVSQNVVPDKGRTFFIMITPTLAKVLGDKSLTKQDIRDSTTVRSSPQLPDPIQIFVAGGSGTRLGIFSGSPRPSVTKKAELPANWNKLVTKYKNVVPTYALY
ncbi:hypothetical protein ACFLW0_07115 [Chloroflexota bacterium]